MNKKLKLPLFERIISSQNESMENNPSLEEKYIASVKSNIEEILKTRNSQLDINPEIRYSAPFFGIDAFDANNITPDFIDKLLAQVKESIEHFEPRVEDINVEYLMDENGVFVLNLSFLITELDKKDILSYIVSKEK